MARMSTLDERLRALLPAHRATAIAAASIPRPSAPTGAAGSDDVVQMVDGFLGLLDEELTPGPKERRAFFLETVIPSLVQTGLDPWALLQGSIYFSIVLCHGLASAAAPADHDAAVARLGHFFAGYLEDMGRIAMKAAR
jgi:hypothetical protein